MRKYLLLILLVIAMPVRAESEETPEKFKNPIFNNIIYSSNYKTSHDSKVTPTYIKDLMTGYDEECSYITEDDQAILLKCSPVEKGLFEAIGYEMFFAKYKTVFEYSKEQSCNVWWCSFHIVNGYITNDYMAAMNTKVANCDDEEEYTIYTEFSCLSELKARGWDKYIPAKLPDEKK